MSTSPSPSTPTESPPDKFAPLRAVLNTRRARDFSWDQVQWSNTEAALVLAELDAVIAERDRLRTALERALPLGTTVFDFVNNQVREVSS